LKAKKSTLEEQVGDNGLLEHTGVRALPGENSIEKENLRD
jgi:hypothetical protein